MELILHYIEELQRITDDLATANASIDKERYEADCELFLSRIEAFLTENNLENSEYMEAKLAEIRAGLSYLLRESNTFTNPARYQALIHSGLNGIYRNMRNPVTASANDLPYDDESAA